MQAHIIQTIFKLMSILQNAVFDALFHAVDAQKRQKILFFIKYINNAF